MSANCEICRGAKIVRLAIYRSVPMTICDGIEEAEAPPWREFPCPECGMSVKQERVAVLEAHAMVDSRIDDPSFADHTHRSAAHQLVEHLLKGGFITFERGPVDQRWMRYPVVASLGAVSPGQVATLEQRVAERQDQVAIAVAREAKRQIDNWGSHYGHADILKRDARAQIDSALQRVLGSWSKIRSLKAND